MNKKNMVFSEYEWQRELKDNGLIYQLGLTSGSTYYKDPKRLLFGLSRYKFVSKMLENKKLVAEIGCGDGFYSRLVKQTVENLDCYDIDEIFINDAKSRVDKLFPINFTTHNILEKQLPNLYDAIYSLDVMEHIDQNLENIYLDNITASLKKEGVFIVGMPSLESQIFATADKFEHVNCKTGAELKKSLELYFHNVFIFSMNDEIVHTGFNKLSHYFIAICSTIK